MSGRSARLLLHEVANATVSIGAGEGGGDSPMHVQHVAPEAATSCQCNSVPTGHSSAGDTTSPRVVSPGSQTQRMHCMYFLWPRNILFESAGLQAYTGPTSQMQQHPAFEKLDTCMHPTTTTALACPWRSSFQQTSLLRTRQPGCAGPGCSVIVSEEGNES